MTFTELAHPIFEQSIADYHIYDNIDQPIQNPYQAGTIEHDLYLKNWIDTVQWHFEDVIRDPQINPEEALVLKRRIDKISRLLLNGFHDSWVIVPQCIDGDSLYKVKVTVALDIGEIAPGSTFCHQIRLLIKNGTQILFVIFKFNHNKTSILV